MRILTWNLKRPTPTTLKRNNYFRDQLTALDADIIVLTETNAAIHPGNGSYCAQTIPLPGLHDGFKYAAGENRATIYSRFDVIDLHPTRDPFTGICATLATDYGPFTVYAAIIGILGGRGSRFAEDFSRVQQDVRDLNTGGKFCVIGDFNISFSGHPYPSTAAIHEARSFFEQQRLVVPTASLNDVPDHIAVHTEFLGDKLHTARSVVVPKQMSDHPIVYLDIDNQH